MVLNIKMIKVLSVCFALVALASDIQHAFDVTTDRIELPYDSTTWIKKRIRNGHTFATDLSDPNLQFVTESVVDNFQYFEIKCRICISLQEFMLVLRENFDNEVLEGQPPGIMAYNVYIV
jgi:hypothetical protein